jgi:hypothetical protein
MSTATHTAPRTQKQAKRKDETKRWKVKQDPKHPNDRRYDTWQLKDPKEDPWQTKPSTDHNLATLFPWLQDMEEWNVMMQEAVVELRERVIQLEGRLEKANL